MDRILNEQETSCPFCAERITLLIDASVGSQQYIEDCHVCCRPIQVTISAPNNELESVSVDCAS